MDVRSADLTTLRVRCFDPRCPPETLAAIASAHPSLAGLARANPGWVDQPAGTRGADTAELGEHGPNQQQFSPWSAQGSAPWPAAVTEPTLTNPLPEGLPEAPPASETTAGAGYLLGRTGRLLWRTWPRLLIVLAGCVIAALVAAATTVFAVLLQPGHLAYIVGLGTQLPDASPTSAQWLAAVLQTVALAGSGELALSAVNLGQTDWGGPLSVQGAVIMVPWLVTITVALAAFLTARFLGPRNTTGPERIIWSLCAGLGYTGLVTVGVLAEPATIPMTTLRPANIAGGFGMVAGCVFLGLDRRSRGRERRPWSAAFCSGIGFAAIGSAAAFFGVAASQNVGPMQLWPGHVLFGPVVGWLHFVAGMGGTVQVDSYALALTTANDNADMALLSTPTWTAQTLLGVLLLALVCGAVAGFRCRQSWPGLVRYPLAWTAVGLALQSLVRFELSLTASYFDSGSAESTATWFSTLCAASNTFALFALWGVVAAAAAFTAGRLRAAAGRISVPPEPDAASGVRTR